MTPKPRTPNDTFDPEEMEKELKQFAKTKQLGWDWEFASYDKRRRGQGPDRDGLVMYFDVLKIVLLFAPFAHPALSLLRMVWGSLHRKYDIMSKEAKKYMVRAIATSGLMIRAIVCELCASTS